MIRFGTKNLSESAKLILQEQSSAWDTLTDNNTKMAEIKTSFNSVPFTYLDGTSQLVLSSVPTPFPWSIGAHLIAKYSPLNRTPMDRFKYNLEFFLTKQPNQPFNQSFHGVNSTSIRGGTDDKYGFVFGILSAYPDNKTKNWTYSFGFESPMYDETIKFKFPKKTNSETLASLLKPSFSRIYNMFPSNLVTLINNELARLGYLPLPQSITFILKSS